MTHEDAIKVSSVLKWVAGVMSVLCTGAIISLLVTWADVRQMKADLARQQQESVKAERIAALETEVANLKHDGEQHADAHRALWQALGRKADR